jgi:hypothetical protein
MWWYRPEPAQILWNTGAPQAEGLGMGWLLLAAFGILWAALLLGPARRRSPDRTVEEFERGMDLLAETDWGGQGRWIVTPKKGVPLLGPQARAQVRARERRRRVFVFFLESIGLSFMIGLVPPLRPVWYATATLATLLGGYVWMLLSIKQRAPQSAAERSQAVRSIPERPRPVRERYASDAAGRTRPVFDGLGAFAADEFATITVKPAHELGANA